MGSGPVDSAVADADPRIHLAEIGRLDLLAALGRVVVPDLVWEEAVGRGRVSESALISVGTIQRHPSKHADVEAFQGTNELGHIQGGYIDVGPGDRGIRVSFRDTTHVLYHAQCQDGFGGAWAAWRALRNDAQYVPVQHGDPPPPLPEGARVVVVDFAYPREVILGLRERLGRLTILDHHKTAEEALRGLPDTIFDMDKSGAMLAWEYFHPGQAPPTLIRYVQDRDLWRFELPQSREVNAALGSYPQDFATWNAIDVDRLVEEGRAILRFRDQTIASIISHARTGDVGGHDVPIVNATAHWSDVGEALLRKYPQAPFVALYFDDAEGRRRWSLRSHGEFDVAELAKRFGGGGHRAAAGFREPPRPFTPPVPADA